MHFIAVDFQRSDSSIACVTLRVKRTEIEESQLKIERERERKRIVFAAKGVEVFILTEQEFAIWRLHLEILELLDRDCDLGKHHRRQ